MKTSLSNSSLYDYSDAYILVKGTIAGAGADGAARVADRNDIKAIFRTSVPFTECKQNNQLISR